METIIPLLKETVRTLKTPAVGVIAEETNDPFRVLISCILSLRTRDAVTESASARLFELADSPGGMVSLAVEAIEKAIYPVSFYRNKARSILKISRALLDRFGGKVPDAIAPLLTLPGVGRKTANLVVSVAYKKPAICVDIHVHRISNRLGYIETKHPDESEAALRRKLPKRYWIGYNDLLVPFGQFICTPISPRCSRCVIRPHCRQIGVAKHR